MRSAFALAGSLVLGPGALLAQEASSVLFIGNGFTYGDGSPVRFYRADTVTDLNDEGIGGVPALFKSFADQAGLEFDVYLETRAASAWDFHLEEKTAELTAHPWDYVVAQGYSTLDRENPGDPTSFVSTGTELVSVLVENNPDVAIYLTATWSRADETYPEDGAWHGEPINAMARDVRAGYDMLASSAPGVVAVNPVGEAWDRAMRTGVADANPYDGVSDGQLSLWTYDHYHGSTAGYYLHALVVFGNITGLDPRSLGRGECSGFELGLSGSQVEGLQQVAHDELTANGVSLATPEGIEPPTRRARCVA